MQIDSVAFSNLIAPQGQSIAGGWIGFLNGMVNENADTYQEILVSKVEYPLPETPTCTPPDTVKGVLAGVSSFIGIAVLAVMAPEFGLRVIGTLIGAAAVGGISGYQASRGTC
jgi:hypothetical protein